MQLPFSAKWLSIAATLLSVASDKYIQHI